MPLAAFEKTVRVVNRVIRPDGTHVPYTAYFGGETVTFDDHLDVPPGVASIIIHHSMYRQEPDTFVADYRLGCEEFDTPITPIPEVEVQRSELIDRDLLPPDRHFGAPDRWGRKLQGYTRVYRPARHDPLSVVDPGSGDGVFAGTYGEPRPSP